MHRPRSILTFAVSLLVLAHAAATLVVAAPQAAASDAGVERGLHLYRQGDTKGAAKEFRAAAKRRKEDPQVWLYLGQALVMHGDMKDARKALETSLRLKPDSAEAHAALGYLHFLTGKPREAEALAKRALELDSKLVDARYVLGFLRLREGAWLKALEEAEAILKSDERAAGAYSLKTQALIGLYERGVAVLSDERRGAYDFDARTVEETRAAQPQRLKEAADSLEKYLRLAPTSPGAAELREEIQALRFFSETDPARRVYSASETTERAVIESKPTPGYTDEARRANISGVVRLRAVLAADGRVRHVLVIRRLSHGLTEKSVAAARRIKFKPAKVNGTPVAQAVVLEYNFNVY